MRSASSRLTSSRRPAGEATRHQAAHLGVEQCGITSLPKDGETQHLTRDRLSAMNINIDVSRSPRAPATARRTKAKSSFCTRSSTGTATSP